MRTKFEDLEIFQLAEKLADAIWQMAVCWDSFAKNTVGIQIVDAADGVGSALLKDQGKVVTEISEDMLKSPEVHFTKRNIG